MTIIASCNAFEKRLENSRDRILSNCSEYWQDEIRKLPLIVADDLKAEEIYSGDYGIFKKAYSGAFGATKGNIVFQGNRVHLVVLNITKIDLLQLDNDEFDGVFSHELGHLFNQNPVKEMPSLLNENTLTEINDAKTFALKESEFYADYFSKITRSSKGLSSSMKKYLKSADSSHLDLFQERLVKLNSEEILLGTIKTIK